MKRVIFAIFIATTVMLCLVVARTQDSQPKSTPDDEDKVYLPQDVDVRAKIESQVVDGMPKVGKDCPKTGMVALRAILRKSRKVTDVKLIRGVGCSFDQQEVERIGKLKFRPARKSGHAVSQYAYFETWIPRL